MAGQNYVWQISTPNIGTGKGVISSAYEVDGKSPLTTVTSTNPDGFVQVNSLSNNPIVSKTEYKIDEKGIITYRYTSQNNEKFIYNSTQEIIDNVSGASSSVVYQITSAVQSSILADARQKNIGQGPIASLPPSAAVPGTGPVGNQVVGSIPPPEDTTVDISNLSQINPDEPNPTFSTAFGRSDLVYPTKIRDNGQDFIKFAFIKYVPRKLDTSGAIGILKERDKTKEDILGNVILPIQPSISDSNSVDWNGLGINPLEMEMTSGSLNLMSGSGQQYVTGLVDRLTGMGKDQNVINAVKLYFAQKAAGVSGLLSRVSGAIVNPNLELLFQGPTLRPFTFTFRLSPRDQEEAKIVRQIIRAFKQYSAVGTASNNLFLTTPNVFKIQYVSKGSKGEENDHKSLNRIKTCALKSVNVDYTPDGSYMTFNDEARTMTSYNLSLQFQELEPVTTSDYINNKIPYNEIGY